MTLGSALAGGDRPVFQRRRLRPSRSEMTPMVELEIARELTGRRRNRLFVYYRCLAMPKEGTERR